MEKLSFRVSSGLKNIIGRELITDKVIAIFELVKNSYDAGAKRVDISFNNIKSENASIIISDNGCGMNKQDLIDKWLFVAYSEKKNIRNATYVDNLNGNRTYAGAKGVGRFSCDRLGNFLDLFSKKEGEIETNLLTVNWDDFERDSQEEFIDISVQHKYVDALPSQNSKGTSVVIRGLRENWDRNDIINLKKSLVKLVNPYENKDDLFEIFLHCEEELINDHKKKNDREKINGKLNNYVFETLNLKTTQISVVISDDGETITTQMYDRGVYLFKLVQKSNFLYLKNIMIELFYLNQASKINFRKIMGIPPVEFGSIFVYKNGFRTMPYGEPGSDIFNIDRRKAQGYNRYLGTRDLMGRIIVLGDNQDFLETSSRDGGFIRTMAYDELDDFYHKYAHIPLEKYVVNLIKWGEDNDSGEAVVSPEEIKDEIIKYITNYEKKGELISVDVNRDLFNIIEEKKEKKSTEIITEIRNIAQQYKDRDLEKLAQKVEQQNKQFQRERQELVKQFDETSEELETKEIELQTTKKQAMFLKGLTNPKYENATESLHMMNTYAKSIKLNINKVTKEIEKSSDKLLVDKVRNYIYEIVKATQKINGTYTFAFSADYDIKQQIQKTNIFDFITQYVDNALLAKTGEFIKVTVNSTDKECEVKINPLEFSMIIENIIYNSYKARAKNLNIIITNDDYFVYIEFLDDGVGLNNKIEHTERIFELGFTTTNGTGVGLSHAKKTIEQWGGTIDIIDTLGKGFSIKVRLKDEHGV